MENRADNREQLNEPSNKKVLLKRGFLLLRLTGIVIFIIILTRVDLSSIWQHLVEADPAFFIAAMLFQFILLFLKAYRWYLLNPGARQKGSILQSFGEFFESYAIGVITPGRMGELLKAGYAERRTGIVGSGLRVLVERGLDLGFFLLIAGSSIAFASLVAIYNLWGWLILIAGTAVVIIAILLLTSKKTLKLVNSILLRIRITKEPISYESQGTGTNLAIFLLSIGSNLSYFISCYFLSLAISLEASFLYISGGVAIAGLLNMLPVTVMGLGTRELTFLYVFNNYMKSQVLALSGLVFLVAQVGGGLISLIAGEIFLFAAKQKKNE